MNINFYLARIEDPHKCLKYLMENSLKIKEREVSNSLKQFYIESENKTFTFNVKDDLDALLNAVEIYLTSCRRCKFCEPKDSTKCYMRDDFYKSLRLFKSDRF